ncbi:MAG TPA: ATP-binding protein [Ktedonobacterales bacterium]
MDTFLQAGLAQVTIALSAFNLITFLWLGLMVLLLGDRRNLITWVGGLGLLLAALFFLCHGALAGAGVPEGASASDVWWRMSWLPAFAAPLFWAATGLHYAGLAGVWKRLRTPMLASVAGLGLLALLLAFLYWPALAHYGDFIRLLDASLRLRQPTHPSPNVSPVLPALALAFVFYIGVCACLPWILLVARRLLPDMRQQRTRMESDATLLWDPGDAWSRARRGLIGASLFMMAAGAVVAGIGALVLLAEHRASLSTVVTGPLPIQVPVTRPGHVPIVLVSADLVVQVALAGLGLMLGQAVLRQGILVERRLPQRGYLSHWRGMALVAGVLAATVAWMANLEPEALPDLLLLVALITGAYAVVTWQSFAAHDRLLAQMRPFIASLTTGQARWLATDPREIERNVEALFTSLCRDVLGAARGRLSLTAGRLHRTFVYAAPDSSVNDLRDRQEWALPVSDERGVVARLVLGPRVDGAGYTSADLEVARACGQRILDAVGEFAAAQAIASLARRRGLEAELSAALPRRVLHDEVLPRLHLAMLRLETLRARLPAARIAEPAGAPNAPSASSASLPLAESAGASDPSAASASEELEAVVHELGQAHHDLAALMRASPIANKRHLEHGLVSALRAALDGEFRGTFDALTFSVPDDARTAADTLTPIVADLLLGAAQEALRNAGRHARGGDLHRRLAVRVSLEADDHTVTITVADDGVGLQSEHTGDGQPDGQDGADVTSVVVQPAETAGTHSGLLTHGALIALVGGTLTVHSVPSKGTTVTIRVPRLDVSGSAPASASGGTPH